MICFVYVILTDGIAILLAKTQMMSTHFILPYELWLRLPSPSALRLHSCHIFETHLPVVRVYRIALRGYNPCLSCISFLI
jgi:hypothetical protein